ncbi:MAG: hypothetical protein KIH69_012130 [Anaerolineae bacterium]|nr:hypothetical protein [Anaerolineae bacterium]
MSTNYLPQSDDTTWKKRLELTQNISVNIGTGASGQVASALGVMLKNVRGFSALFFHQVKSSEPPVGTTRAFALNAILNQIGADLAAATWVAAQRGADAPTGLGVDWAMLDAHARMMVNRAVDFGLFGADHNHIPTKSKAIEPRPVPITCAGRLPATRIIPYCPVALVGVPMYAMNGQDDALARAYVAREIGRMAFWKGTWRDDVLEWYGDTKMMHRMNVFLRAKGYSQWIIDTAATLFSDVFAALTMGKAGLDLALTQAQTHATDRFYAEDQRYELNAILRPEIYIRVLELMGEAEIGKIKADVGNRLQDAYANAGQFTPYQSNGAGGSGTYANVSYQAARNELRGAAEAVYEVLQANKLQATADHAIIEAQYATNTIAWGEWDAAQPWADDPDWTEWFDILERDERQRLKEAFDRKVLDKNYHANNDDFAPIYWRKLLYARGWVMESPENTGGMP